MLAPFFAVFRRAGLERHAPLTEPKGVIHLTPYSDGLIRGRAVTPEPCLTGPSISILQFRQKGKSHSRD